MFSALLHPPLAEPPRYQVMCDGCGSSGVHDNNIIMLTPYVPRLFEAATDVCTWSQQHQYRIEISWGKIFVTFVGKLTYTTFSLTKR